MLSSLLCARSLLLLFFSFFEDELSYVRETSGKGGRERERAKQKTH